MMSHLIQTGVFIFTLSLSLTQAEILPPKDEVGLAYDLALKELLEGKDRQGIADRLKLVVDRHSSSFYLDVTKPFLTDLAATAKSPPVAADAPPELRLANAQIPFYLLRYEDNWTTALKGFTEREPENAVSRLVSADRSVISRLIPLLKDRTPTPSMYIDSDRATRAIPRVCDVALALIEYHGKVKFYHEPFFGTYLHQLPEPEHQKVIDRVSQWWAEVKDKSLMAGVRAQLPYGLTYPETVSMAKTLARLSDGQNTDDREYALSHLLRLVKEHPRTHLGVYAAEALAELGDFSAVEIFYEAWKAPPKGIIRDGGITIYLCRHGGRREWELLYKIAQEESLSKKSTELGNPVLLSVVNSNEAKENLYAVPILVLALNQQEENRQRYIDDVLRSLSDADLACELLQKHVSKDFGHRLNKSSAERKAALQKAQVWWESEGKETYSLDRIQQRLAR